MKNQPFHLMKAASFFLAMGALSATVLAQTLEPAQKPLLAVQTGAKPNLMISLDNSGSMAFTYHETYGISTDSNSQYEVRRCPDQYWSDLTGAWIKGGIADFRNSNRCIYQSGNNYYYNNNLSVQFSPRAYVSNSGAAQRAAEVNPIYYNPRTTYSPRVSANGTPLESEDGVYFISNQNSANFDYRVYKNNSNSNQIRTTHSMYASNPSVSSGWTEVYGLSYNLRIPQHITYPETGTGRYSSSSSPAFTYNYCSNVTTVAGLQMGCASYTTVNFRRGGSPSTITLPSDHQRTDCNGSTCTNAQEATNILNWYRYYAFRAPAVATAIGQALANNDYYDQLRLGYISINRRNDTTISPINQTPGIDNNINLLRGVRLHTKDSTNTQRLYTWLYDQDGTQNGTSNSGNNPAFNNFTATRMFAPHGGTPLHNVLDKVANYYKVQTTTAENPWARNPAAPASSGNEEMTCRRSFNLLFSDGAWNAGTSTISGEDFDNTQGPTFTRTRADGTTESFRYRPTGVNTAAGRKQYVPYPSTATGGLADLAAKYYWHEDLRSSLSNEILADTGQPTFWQNVATYTVGYLIRPSGNVQGATSGLTFDQIDNYTTQYASTGYAGATKPTWATGDVNASTADDQTRVDDFIQAGYTGGGKGFSAQTADDVRNIFDTVLADILNSAGRDAGVAVSTDASTASTIAGRLKYSVSYKTQDNSGDISAQELDADGNVVRDASDLPVTKWTASEELPAPGSRNVFTYSSTNGGGISFSGNFSGLPTDVQASLKYGSDAARVPNNANFVNYLRGADPVADAQGKLFRQRNSLIGAMVNPPSIYMGGSRDFAYDLSGTVSGGNEYLDFVTRKTAYPASLFVATNAGVVHNLDAQDGTELAAFMPRRSMKRLLNYARDAYTFEYVLDGPLSEHDIYDGTRWNHIAVGSGGRGEKLIYALRSPLNGTADAGNRTPTRQDYLWETGPTSGPQTVGSTTETNVINTTGFALGHITHPSRSGQTENGTWVVLINSGHYNGYSDGSRHGLVALNPMTGAVIARIPLPSGYSAGRGLSGVTLVRNADKRIVAAYAGDANGNLWRFDLRGAPSSWRVSYNRPLFTTANNRPIYSAPAWQAHPEKGTVVVVATGILLEDSDITDATDPNKKEAIYGIWDPTPIGEDDASPYTPPSVSDLIVRGIVGGTNVTNNDRTYSRNSNDKIDWTVHRGWTFALGHTYPGERSLDQIRNVSTSVFINTTVVAPPENAEDETCSISGLPKNYIYGLRAIDGASQYSFDTNDDGKLDNVSMVLIDSGGYSRGVAFLSVTDETSDTTSARERRGIDTDAGESSTSPQSCENAKKVGMGTEDGGELLGVYCPVPGWSRTQYQLSTPPSN